MSLPQEYIDAVTKLANDKTNRRFLNDSGEHAKLLIDLMIGKSKQGEQVIIYSGELKANCFGDALKTAKGDIRILLDDNAGFSVIKNLPEDVQKRIQVKLVEQKDQSHFFISGTAMRFERNHNDATAVANFNEPEEKLTILRSRFEQMWESAIGA